LQQQAYQKVQDNQGFYKQPLADTQSSMLDLSTKGTADDLLSNQSEYLDPSRVQTNLNNAENNWDYAAALSPLTNAANALEADKINAQLALSASQYNAAEKNKVAIFNKSAADELSKFNAQEANDRAEFNANLSGQINIANAKVLADVSTANTRETNAMAAVNAKNATDLSASTYAQLSQTYRDQLETTWKTSDNAAARANEIAKVNITSAATKYAGDAAADAAYYAALGSLSASLLTTSGGSKIAESLANTVLGWFKGEKK